MSMMRLDAERLLDQLAQAKLAIERIVQNRAYEAHSDDILAWPELVGEISNVVRDLHRSIRIFEIRDPTQTIFREEWARFGQSLEANKRNFEEQVQKPIAHLMQEVEGIAAKNRWTPDFSKLRAAPPVVEVRNRWALLVGVSDYREAGLNSLSTCKADASVIHDLLRSDQRYGYEPSQTKMFLDNRARRDDVMTAVEQWAKAAGSEDMLFFYFSGHGSLAGKDAILIPYDYDRDTPKKTAIEIAKVTSLVQSSRARAKIIVLDACHSGPDILVGEKAKEAIEEKGMDPAFEAQVRVFEQAIGTAVLTSCVARQVSWTYQETGLSAFTYFLHQGLQGAADFDRKGFVTVSDVFHYVVNEVRRWSEERLSVLQTPALSYTTTGEIILIDHR